MEMDSRKLVADNGQIEFAEASGIGDHVDLCDFPLLHCAANHDTQPPAGSYDNPHGSIDKNWSRESGKIRVSAPFRLPSLHHGVL